MNNSQLDLPMFENWSTFSNDQLQGMLITWQWIKSNPAWAAWHEGADQFIAEIEAELRTRQNPSPDARCTATGSYILDRLDRGNDRVNKKLKCNTCS